MDGDPVMMLGLSCVDVIQKVHQHVYYHCRCVGEQNALLSITTFIFIAHGAHQYTHYHCRYVGGHLVVLIITFLNTAALGCLHLFPILAAIYLEGFGV